MTDSFKLDQQGKHKLFPTLQHIWEINLWGPWAVPVCSWNPSVASAL